MSTPLSTLMATPTVPVVTVDNGPYSRGKNAEYMGGFGAFLGSFIGLAVVIWIIIFSLKPSWVLVRGGTEVDTVKVLWSAIIIALIIVVIIWLIKSLAGGRGC